MSRLHDAAMFGDLETVRRLISRENINMTRPGPLNIIGAGLTPLAEASSFGHTAVVRFLLDAGASVDSYPSPMRLANEGGFDDVVRMLTEHRADVNETDRRGYSLLHRACSIGEVEVVKALLEKGAEIDAKDSDNQTPLHIACDQGRLEVIKVLLKNGAKVNEKGEEGAAPLHLAIRNEEIVKLLLEHGASLDVGDEDGLTPIDWAKGTATEKILTEHRAAEGKRRRRRRKKEKRRKQKCNAAQASEHDEERAGNSEELPASSEEIPNPFGASQPDFMLDLCIMAKAKQWDEWRAAGDASAPQPNPINFQRLGLTPLAQACLKGQANEVRALLAAGSSLRSHPSPLRLAGDGDFIDIIRMLLARGADVNETNQRGWTNLHSASFRGNLEVIKVLLEHKANVNIKSRDGETPLHVACDANRLEVVKMLLQHGAKVNEKGEEGTTPLHIACFRSKEMVQLLLDFGANPDVEDEDGFTPLQSTDPEIVRILRQHKAAASKTPKNKTRRGPRK